MGSPELPGVIPRFCEELFGRIGHREKEEVGSCLGSLLCRLMNILIHAIIFKPLNGKIESKLKEIHILSIKTKTLGYTLYAPDL